MTATSAAEAANSPWATAVVLGDGDTAFIRPLTPDDRDELQRFHRAQSRDSIYRRYFSPKPELTEAELERFTNVDMEARAALAVMLRDEFIGWASYEQWPGRDEAEVAFQVDDHNQGKGIATLLLEHLAAIAATNGIRRFTAEVLGDNRAMLNVFAKAGWPLQRRFDSGVVDLDWELTSTDEFLDSVERREQRADSRAVARLLLPRAVAVIGASPWPGTVGAALWHHVRDSSAAPAYPVNPSHAEIDGERCYPTVDDLPDEVSLAIVAVPAAALEATLAACIRKRMRGAVVITNVDRTVQDGDPAGHCNDGFDRSGFAEVVRNARRSGLRIIGPSSMGLASPRADTRLQGALVAVDLPPGGVALSIQSGSLGASLLRRGREIGLGVSWFVSLGQKSDISGNDLLQFWDEDQATTVIGMYSESLGNPTKFARIARRVSRRKPIVAVRTGVAGDDAEARALHRRAGLIEVPTVHALLDTVRVLADQPVLRGPNVAVISNSQSPTTLATAALRLEGLEAAAGPWSIDWTAAPDDYARAVRTATTTDDVHGVLVIHAPALVDEVGSPAIAIDRAAADADVPVVAVMLGADEGPIAKGSRVPTFAFPEQAVAALGRSAEYGRWLATDGSAEDHDGDDAVRAVDPEGAAALIRAALAADAVPATHAIPATHAMPDGDSPPDAHLDGHPVVLAPHAAHDLLAHYGLDMPVSRRTAAGDAAETAREIGFPVAIKAARRRPGRSARAGVALDVDDVDDVEHAVDTMISALGEDAEPLLVQEMAEPGVDLRIRCRRDATVGVIIDVGLGGIAADITSPPSSRSAPVSPATAMTMLGETPALAALAAAGFDPSRVVDAIVQAGHLAVDHDAIAEIDLNPIIVSAHRAAVTDAAITVTTPGSDAGMVRRLD